MAVVCACLPVIRPLVKKVVHWVVGSANRGRSTNMSSHSGTHRKLWNRKASSFSLSESAKRHNMKFMRLEAGQESESRAEKPQPLHLKYQLSPLGTLNTANSERFQFNNLETRTDGVPPRSAM